MPEAMKKIRHELGHDAVILNSKEIETGGFLGFFTKKSIEVIAAIDNTPSIQRPSKKKPNKINVNVKKEMSDSMKGSPVQQVSIKRNEKEVQKDNDVLANEIQQLKKMITTMSTKSETSMKEYPEPFQQINDFLEEQEFKTSLRLEIIKHLLKKWYNSDERDQNEENVQIWLKEFLYDQLLTVKLGGISFEKKFVNVVGPTGVGKTTTIAKIAAHCVLKKKKKVALITTDTYRIAAVEQLRTYAKILNIPLEVAYSIADFKKAKEQFSQEYDLVLVDSAGRNFRNRLYVEELKKTIDFDEEMETFLVLALTSKYKDMEKIYEQFSLIPITKLVFTKKDETSYYGTMFNLITDHQTGIAYITTGQNVPDDIVEASSDEIVNIIIGVQNNE